MITEQKEVYRMLREHLMMRSYDEFTLDNVEEFVPHREEFFKVHPEFAHYDDDISVVWQTVRFFSSEYVKCHGVGICELGNKERNILFVA